MVRVRVRFITDLFPLLNMGPHCNTAVVAVSKKSKPRPGYPGLDFFVSGTLTFCDFVSDLVIGIDQEFYNTTYSKNHIGKQALIQKLVRPSCNII